jgi:hypothetical protein
MVGPADGEPRTEIRAFGTTVSELERLRAWLKSEGWGEIQPSSVEGLRHRGRTDITAFVVESIIAEW